MKEKDKIVNETNFSKDSRLSYRSVNSSVIFLKDDKKNGIYVHHAENLKNILTTIIKKHGLDNVFETLEQHHAWTFFDFELDKFLTDNDEADLWNFDLVEKYGLAYRDVHDSQKFTLKQSIDDRFIKNVYIIDENGNVVDVSNNELNDDNSFEVDNELEELEDDLSVLNEEVLKEYLIENQKF